MTDTDHDELTPAASLDLPEDTRPHAETEAEAAAALFGDNGFRIVGPRAPLFAALAKAQGAFEQLSCNKTSEVQLKTGGSYTHDFADLAEILEGTRKALSEADLALLQPLCSLEKGYHELRTMLLHSSGAFIESSLVLSPVDGPQALGSLVTYGRRYALQSLLGVAAEKDDDGNRAQGNAATVTQRTRSQGQKSSGSKASSKKTNTRSKAAETPPAAEARPEPVEVPTREAAPAEDAGPPYTTEQEKKLQTIREEGGISGAEMAKKLRDLTGLAPADLKGPGGSRAAQKLIDHYSK